MRMIAILLLIGSFAVPHTAGAAPAFAASVLSEARALGVKIPARSQLTRGQLVLIKGVLESDNNNHRKKNQIRAIVRR